MYYVTSSDDELYLSFAWYDIGHNGIFFATKSKLHRLCSANCDILSLTDETVKIGIPQRSIYRFILLDSGGIG